MPIYQSILADKFVGAIASSSPGTGWSVVPDLQTLINNARSANLPLFLRAGTYPSTQISISSSNGGGNPLVLSGVPGKTTIQLSGSAQYLLSINYVNNVKISNIAFDGNNIALTDPAITAGLINVSAAKSFVINDCTVINSKLAGVSCYLLSEGTIFNTSIRNCNIGVFCYDATILIDKNNVEFCRNNGIVIFAGGDKSIFNGSVISRNGVHDIANEAGGSGEYGNGVVVYLANGVKVNENTIYKCTFSAVRVNGANDCIVSANYCADLGSVPCGSKRRDPVPT
jgi:uncharacterized secreted repeat protein (TIGR03808 family)